MSFSLLLRECYYVELETKKIRNTARVKAPKLSLTAYKDHSAGIEMEILEPCGKALYLFNKYFFEGIHSIQTAHTLILCITQLV